MLAREDMVLQYTCMSVQHVFLQVSSITVRELRVRTTLLVMFCPMFSHDVIALCMRDSQDPSANVRNTQHIHA